MPADEGFLEWLRNMFIDSDQAQQFAQDPGQMLNAAGFPDVTPSDVVEGIQTIAPDLPPEISSMVSNLAPPELHTGGDAGSPAEALAAAAQTINYYISGGEVTIDQSDDDVTINAGGDVDFATEGSTIDAGADAPGFMAAAGPLGDIIDAGESALGAGADFVTDSVEGMGSGLAAGAEALGGLGLSGVEAGLGVAGDVAGTGFEVVQDLGGGAFDVAGDLAGGAVDIGSDLISGAGDVGSNLMEGDVLGAGEAVVDTVGDVAGDVVDTVGDVASDVGDTVMDTGEDIIDGAGDVLDDLNPF